MKANTSIRCKCEHLTEEHRSYLLECECPGCDCKEFSRSANDHVSILETASVESLQSQLATAHEIIGKGEGQLRAEVEMRESWKHRAEIAEAAWRECLSQLAFLTTACGDAKAQIEKLVMAVGDARSLLREWVAWARLYHVWDHVSNTAAVDVHIRIRETEDSFPK